MVQQTRKQQAKCQCIKGCISPPLPGLPFCRKHKAYCPRKAPLSGYEPIFDPDVYNKYKGIKEAHNCFAYAFNFLGLPDTCTKNDCPIGYPQPGRASGYPSWSKVKGKRCPDLIGRLLGDVPDIRMSRFEKRCPKGMTKIAPVIDEDEDYHFFRQDSNGLWSHKPGATDVSPLDATKRLIFDPLLASRMYPQSGLNYDQFCGYMCVPTDKRKINIKRGGKSRKRRRSHTRQRSYTRQQSHLK